MMGFRVQVQSMSIVMPRGNTHEGVCIATGVMAEGEACEWRKENRVHRGAVCPSHWGECGVSRGTAEDGKPHL
jgi:hypothetical protein